MTLRKHYISYRRDFVGLVTGVADHQPHWVMDDCPNCALGGSYPCEHPDILVCGVCLDEWPCDTIRVVAAELKELGRLLPSIEGWKDPGPAIVEGLTKQIVLKRAAALLRGVRKSDAQHQDQSDLS
jgi:hypothetical protein